MLVKLDDAGLFLKAVEVISELVTEVKIRLNEFGMHITAIDPANVAMLRFKLPKSAFSQFETGDESLGVNLDNLKKILKRCGNSTPLILEKEENLLKIHILDKIKRSFNLNLIEIDRQDKDMPNLEYTAKVELGSKDLILAIEDCSVVSEACSFETVDGKFILEARGLNSARLEFSGDEAQIQSEGCKSRYSLEYLQKFMKAVKISDKAILNFAYKHPLRLDVKTEHMEFNFLLAPRVETDD